MIHSATLTNPTHTNAIKGATMKTMMKNPTSVKELHESLTKSIPTTKQESSPLELRFPQKLRAVAAGAVFAACRPSFTEDDEDDLGYVLGQLAGWVLHGEAYDPDITFADDLRRKEEELRDDVAA